jgi:hypothetical protein
MMKVFFAAFFWMALSVSGAFAQNVIVTANQQPGDPQAVLDAASQLLTKSSQLATAGLRPQAVEAAQAAADVLRGFAPPPDRQAAYFSRFVDALDTLTVRLIEAGRLDEAAAATHETAQVARRAAAVSGVDVNAIASTLVTLSSQLATAGLRPPAVEAAQAAADVLREEGVRRNAWNSTMSRTPLPKKGCFNAKYPNTGWHEVPCGKAPRRPYTVGIDTDWMASAANLISSATGSFDSVTGVGSETGTTTGDGCANPVPNVPNVFSLQLNTDRFDTTVCKNADNPPGSQPPKGAAIPGDCQGWQQFVYSSSSNIVYVQYWLLNYGPPNGPTTCPAGQWNGTKTRPRDCYLNSSTTPVPPQTIANLAQMSLTARANSAADTVTLSVRTGDVPSLSANNQDSALNLAGNWKAAEFNIFGDGCDSDATFDAEPTLVVRTQVDAGARIAPTCAEGSFTAETNNLNLVGTPAVVPTSPSPAIVFTESKAGGTPKTCTGIRGGLTCIQVISSGSTNCTDAGGVPSTCASATCPGGLTLTGGGGACAAGDRKIKSLFPRVGEGSFTIACEKQGVDPEAHAICCRF